MTKRGHRAAVQAAGLLFVVSVSAVAQPQPTAKLTLVKLYSVGSETGSEAEQFGSVEGIASDTSGRIMVLDSRANAVRVFDPGGRFATSVGRSGSGPGELGVTRAVEPDSTGRLHVSTYHQGTDSRPSLRICERPVSDRHGVPVLR